MKGIKIEGLTKYYVGGNNTLLKVFENIYLFIDPNSFTTIIGPSGCGKSTLLQIIAGLIKPDAGRIIKIKS
jgi:NitT/TauT family transport system ATP-binding protein